MDRLNEIRYSRYGTPIKLIEYVSSSNVLAEFQDEHKLRVRTTYTNFNKGNIKNPYDKSVHGIGWVGVGKHKVYENHKTLLKYNVWRNILGRCYVPSDANYKFYSDCEVCPEWFDYQIFCDWYESHMYHVGTERMHVDKDILHDGNKVYSPEHCIIVPQSINEIFHTVLRKTTDLDLPHTIKRVANGRYSASYRGFSLGVHDTVEECEELYMKAKREHIRNKVNELKDELPEYIQEILLNW